VLVYQTRRNKVYYPQGFDEEDDEEMDKWQVKVANRDRKLANRRSSKMVVSNRSIKTIAEIMERQSNIAAATARGADSLTV
jgi:hypothetical protein